MCALCRLFVTVLMRFIAYCLATYIYIWDFFRYLTVVIFLIDIMHNLYEIVSANRVFHRELNIQMKRTLSRMLSS